MSRFKMKREAWRENRIEAEPPLHPLEKAGSRQDAKTPRARRFERSAPVHGRSNSDMFRRLGHSWAVTFLANCCARGRAHPDGCVKMRPDAKMNENGIGHVSQAGLSLLR